MKTTIIKRIITLVLATATVASSAVLFTGCGKTKEEEFAEAFNNLVSDGMNQYSALKEAVSTEETKQKIVVDISKFYDTIVNEKKYSVVFDPDKANTYPSPKFYLSVSSPIEIDGITYTKTKDEELEYGRYRSEWEATFDGKKCILLSFNTEWAGLTNVNSFAFDSSYDKKVSEYDSGVVSVDNNKGKNYEIEIPKALTADECKQRADEVQKLIEANVELKNYKDENPKLEGIYYFQGKQGEECVRAVYSYEFMHQKEYIYHFHIDGNYPFANGSELAAVKWKQNDDYREKPELSNWTKSSNTVF